MTANALTALVVEDNEEIAFLLRFLLERERYHVESANDGRAAEAAIARIAPPSLVVLDIMLPYVDGFQIVQGLRARAGWETVPVIMMTAKSQESDIVRALDAGASDYIVKPFQPNEFLARVRRLVKVAAA